MGCVSVDLKVSAARVFSHLSRGEAPDEECLLIVDGVGSLIQVERGVAVGYDCDINSQGGLPAKHTRPRAVDLKHGAIQDTKQATVINSQ